MEKTGTLKIVNSESRVDGTLLARKNNNGQDEYGAATDFMTDNGCNNNNCVTVTGTMTGAILYIDSATKVGSSPCAAVTAFAAMAPATKKKTRRRSTAAKKKGVNRAPRQAAGKKKPKAAKKSAGKRGRRR